MSEGAADAVEIQTDSVDQHETSDAIAEQKRIEGNKKFIEGAWAAAFDLYNESLYFANPGSVHISLAYANRAWCFYKLKRYDQCLDDIELAKEAGCPHDLMEKFEACKTYCLLKIQSKQNINGDRKWI